MLYILLFISKSNNKNINIDNNIYKVLFIQNIKKKSLNNVKKSYIKKKRNIDSFGYTKINRNRDFLFYANCKENYNDSNIANKKKNRSGFAVLLQISKIYILNRRNNFVIFFIAK